MACGETGDLAQAENFAAGCIASPFTSLRESSGKFLTAMDASEFERFLDSSWLGFRQRLLDAYPLLQAHTSDNSEICAPRDLPRQGSLANVGIPATVPAHIRSRASSVKSHFSVFSSFEDGMDLDKMQTYHGDSETLLGSGISQLSLEQAQKIRNRLRLHLGAISGSTLVGLYENRGPLE